jgi:hypothetical protein
MKNNNINSRIKKFLQNFTLSRCIGALITVTIVACIKYIISGNLHIDYSDFMNNIYIGLLSWSLNIIIIDWLSEYLNLKGINLNLEELIYGKEKLTIGENPSYKNEHKVKLYNSMDSNGESSSNNNIDKGKNIDESYTENLDYMPMDTDDEPLDKGKKVDKGKGVDKKVHSLPLTTEPPVEPHMVTWSKIFPGLDPRDILYPKRINPGPGFNVPGGEVPIRDDICKHIGYNSHILKQFKNMDLKTALEQRNNYLKNLEVLEERTKYAKAVLSSIPEVPNERDYLTKLKILHDLDDYSKQKAQGEGRVILLNSRIEFIQLNWKKD